MESGILHILSSLVFFILGMLMFIGIAVFFFFLLYYFFIYPFTNEGKKEPKDAMSKDIRQLFRSMGVDL
jgi:hypothetical protein